MRPPWLAVTSGRPSGSVWGSTAFRPLQMRCGIRAGGRRGRLAGLYQGPFLWSRPARLSTPAGGNAQSRASGHRASQRLARRSSPRGRETPGSAPLPGFDISPLPFGDAACHRAPGGSVLPWRCSDCDEGRLRLTAEGSAVSHHFYQLLRSLSDAKQLDDG
jgi:hypothetical protein